MTLQTFLQAANVSGLANNGGKGGEFILVGTSKQLEELERRLREGNEVVPGLMKCTRCVFTLTRRNLNVNVGTVTAGNSEPEPCPNGCGPLVPVTWREHATNGWKTAEEQFEALAKVCEAVGLKPHQQAELLAKVVALTAKPAAVYVDRGNVIDEG